MASVGANPRRREGPEKVRGLARYVDDLVLPGCLHAVTLRSTIPCGRIRNISFDPSFPWRECVVARASDIPGENYVLFFEKDQPLLADGVVRHMHEPILLIAHPDRAKAYEALAYVKVEYEPEKPLYDIDESLAGKKLIYGKDNVFKDLTIEKGDVATGFAAAWKIVEAEYWVPHQEQAYLENNGMAAQVEPDGTLVVRGSLQCPYYVLKALKPLLGMTEKRVRVAQMTTGGGFGGKEEYPSMIAGHAAVMALKSKKPVKLIYDRAEDMAATTKRHPARVRHKTAIDRRGRLLAVEIDIVMDGGAYMTCSPVVLSRGALHATGPYTCPNVRLRARSVATNTPPNGAFRGFGAPQTLFAAELQMDRLAHAAGLDPVEIRRRNVLREGTSTHTGQVLRFSVGAEACLERAVKLSGWAAKRRAYGAWNRARKPTWRGLGLALVHHGAGFTGAGETYLASEAGVAIDREGRVRVLAASTEIGQGSTTIFAQIAADTLGVPYEKVSVVLADTGVVPNSGPTVASRTTMVVGGLVNRAAGMLKQAVEEAGGSFADAKRLKAAAAKLCDGAAEPRVGAAEPRVGAAERRFVAKYQQPDWVTWDDKAYRGDAYGCFSYGCLVVDLEIDRSTYEVNVRRLYSAADIGKAIHPLNVEGQLIGGFAQGLGWALLENVVMKDGGMANPSLTNYIIPTFVDMPPVKVEIVEKAYKGGPFGAKGLGEMPMDLPGPAVASAVGFALGKWPDRLPLLPEKILELA